MRIISVATHNIRNLKNQNVPTGNEYNILVGNNGQGKTNFLEAIYCSCYGNSFRKSTLKQIVNFSQTDAFVKTIVELDDGQNIDIVFSIKDGKRRISIQGKEIKDRKDLIYTVPCIVFTHEDIEFVQGSPEDRRKFYNQTLTLYDGLFLDDMRTYRHLLKQRNALLREESYDLLHIYDMQLADVGIEIQKKRETLVVEFNELFPALFRKISGDAFDLKVAYLPSWKHCVTAGDAVHRLNETSDSDKRYQMTTTGPHRDRFMIVRDEKDSSDTAGLRRKRKNYVDTASTGQKRLVSLILRSAQAAFYTRKTGVKPILLLDDVLLELDHTRRELFLENTGGFSQAFFTFLPDEKYFRKDGYKGNVYTVLDGEIAIQ